MFRDSSSPASCQGQLRANWSPKATAPDKRYGKSIQAIEWWQLGTNGKRYNILTNKKAGSFLTLPILHAVSFEFR
jgi:hypothetical protein